MPIKPENRRRYPREWPAIRRQVLERARYRCEWPGCTARHHAVGQWRQSITGRWQWMPLGGNGPCDLAGEGIDYRTDERLSYTEAREYAAANDDPTDRNKMIVIVLTVAHLDHRPENCGLSNLQAMCQRHHLAYDQEHHQTSAYMTRRARLGNLELPL